MGAPCRQGGRLNPRVVLDLLADAGAVLEIAAVALIVAHPDDDVIGAATLLPRLPQCCVLYVTDGAPRRMTDAWAAGLATREAYAHARRREAEAALAIAGLPAGQIFGFGIPDQEASFRLAELPRRLADFLVGRRTRVVITHAYEGGHPDHDATAFGVHAARALIARMGDTAPVIIEMAGYHAGPHGLVTHEFLPAAGTSEGTVRLTPAERLRKRRMLDCHATQAATLSQFGLEVERFRTAPGYDFGLPPHPGRLWYERFDWGLGSGETWRRLASQALGELALGDAQASTRASSACETG